MNIVKILSIMLLLGTTLDAKIIISNMDIFDIRKFDTLNIEELIKKDILFSKDDIELSHIKVKRLHEDTYLNLYLLQSHNDYIDFVFFNKEENTNIILNYFISRLEYINIGIKLGYIHFNEDFMNFSSVCIDEYQMDSNKTLQSFGSKYENRIFHTDRIGTNKYIIKKLKEYISKKKP